MIRSVEHRPEMAVFEYREMGMAMEHNYYCPVCRDHSAVISRGILQPCWSCQKKNYKLVKLSWIGKKILSLIDKLQK